MAVLCIFINRLKENESEGIIQIENSYGFVSLFYCSWAVFMPASQLTANSTPLMKVAETGKDRDK